MFLQKLQAILQYWWKNLTAEQIFQCFVSQKFFFQLNFDDFFHLKKNSLKSRHFQPISSKCHLRNICHLK